MVLPSLPFTMQIGGYYISLMLPLVPLPVTFFQIIFRLYLASLSSELVLSLVLFALALSSRSLVSLLMVYVIFSHKLQSLLLSNTYHSKAVHSGEEVGKGGCSPSEKLNEVFIP